MIKSTLLGDVLTHTYQIMQKIEKYWEVISFLYSVPPASCRPVPPAAATLSALSLSLNLPSHDLSLPLDIWNKSHCYISKFTL